VGAPTVESNPNDQTLMDEQLAMAKVEEAHDPHHLQPLLLPQQLFASGP